jgi:UDPglucose 6-dehydrogenase
VQAYDPEGMTEATKYLQDLTFCDGPYQAAAKADALVILTEWDQFRALDFERIKDMMASPVVVDLRNIYSSKDMRDDGFTYVSIGRP